MSKNSTEQTVIRKFDNGSVVLMNASADIMSLLTYEDSYNRAT
jgi:hypothetical protein